MTSCMVNKYLKHIKFEKRNFIKETEDTATVVRHLQHSSLLKIY